MTPGQALTIPVCHRPPLCSDRVSGRGGFNEMRGGGYDRRDYDRRDDRRDYDRRDYDRRDYDRRDYDRRDYDRRDYDRRDYDRRGDRRDDRD